MPTLSVVSEGTQAGTSGNLNAAGNWVWTVQVTPDFGVVTGGAASGTPLTQNSVLPRVRMGRQLVRSSKNVANASPSVFDTNSPGTSIFGWETTYGSPLQPEGLEANCTGCTVTNTAASGRGIMQRKLLEP